MRVPLALAAAAAAMAFALGLFLPTAAFAQGSGEWIKFVFTPQAGLNSTCLSCGWHTGTCGPTQGPALDFGGRSDCSDSQHSVYFRNFAFLPPGSSNTYVGRAAAYAHPYAICRQVEVRIWDTGTNLLATMWYTHTDLTYPETIWLYANENGYENEQVVAAMANPDNQECIDLDGWEGPHLHELHEDGESTFFLRNDGICGEDCGEDWDERYPCGPQSPYCYDIDPQDWWNNWVRAFCIDDTDCDGWTDDEEDYIGTDPLDDCPDNSADDAWPPDINNDTWVNTTDILMFPANVLMPAQRGVEPTYDPRYDLTTDDWINSSDILLYAQNLVMPAQCTNP